ncbi:Ferredoxin fas2 [Nocardioides aquaticus]|uniref:Ferredoxin fas2 n=1 Tax=Nocardioides aquaticus TaxID=160826 RepID=A0ABX8EBD6_9ACTN|nr:ferredoxin [Nocardioides aquaticus]QVT77712.1 Ferredoxin fas2 [Nocardioides aquaticus]
MRVVADRDTCEGLGMCEAMSELFEVGDDGSVVVHDEQPPEAARADVQAAVDACPVLALRLEG